MAALREDLGEIPRELDDRIARAASAYWLAEAERCCHENERDRMNGALAEAARWYRDALGPLFRDTRRRIRQHALELTSAGHWVDLLRAADAQRASAGERAPDGWRLFAHPRLLEDVELVDETRIERADRDELDRARARWARSHPEPLRERVANAPLELVRAALFVAAGRPDLALLPLVELSDADPLVCLERARVACALGFPNTAMLALGDFASLFGGHITVRRLNTGVFMAQMAVACGDEARAVEILGELDVPTLGRRPVLLYARLLARVGRDDDGAGVLDRWLADHPDDDEARALLADLAGPDPTEEGLIVDAERETPARAPWR